MGSLRPYGIIKTFTVFLKLDNHQNICVFKRYNSLGGFSLVMEMANN